MSQKVIQTFPYVQIETVLHKLIHVFEEILQLRAHVECA